MTARGRGVLARAAAIAALAAVLLGLLVVTSPTRADADGDRDFSGVPRGCPQKYGTSQICRVTTFEKRPWLVLWGDSHALQYLNPLTAVARHRRVNLVVIYAGGCPLSLPFPASSGEPRLGCDKHNARAFDYVSGLAASKPRLRVILGSYWHWYRSTWERLQEEERNGVADDDSEMTPYLRHVARLGVERSPELFRRLGAAGVHADVLAQSGAIPSEAPPCAEGEEPYVCDLARSTVLPQQRVNRRWLRERTALLSRRPSVIDATSTYCDATTCYGRVDGVPTFYDRSHLGERMTRRMRVWFRPSVRALLQQPRSDQ